MSLTKKDVNTSPNFISDIHPLKHSPNPSPENTSKQKQTNTSYTKIKLIKSTNSRKINKGTDFLEYIKDKGIKFQIHYEGDDDTQETTPPKNRNSTNSTILPPPNTPNKPPSSPNINDNTSKNDTDDDKSNSNKNKSNSNFHNNSINNNSNIYNINVINLRKQYSNVNINYNNTNNNKTNIINNNINNNNTTTNANNINTTTPIHPLTHSSLLNVHACPFIPPKVQNPKMYYSHAQLLKQQQQLRLQHRQQQAAAATSKLLYRVNSVNTFIPPTTSQTPTNPYLPSTQQLYFLNLQYHQLFITYQYQQFILYLKNKQTLLSTSSKSISNEDDPERPFFYHNHNEEVQTTRILALIEFLFHKNNINSDYMLRRLLDEDGYVSVDDLVEKHPLMKKFKISKKTLTDILTLHRQGQITETVETFDTILIRNREWSELGDQLIQNVSAVYSATMMKMNKLYHNLKMRNINNNINVLSNMLKVYNQSMMALQLQQYEKLILLENVNGVI